MSELRGCAAARHEILWKLRTEKPVAKLKP